MNKVYIVEASFEDFETSWIRKVGIFSDYELAKDHLKKWKKFFTQNKKLFNQPKDFVPSTYTDWGDEMYEDWIESDQYYKLISELSDIRYFSDVQIIEFELNRDVFIKSSEPLSSEKLINLMNQWNRNYKLNKLT